MLVAAACGGGGGDDAPVGADGSVAGADAGAGGVDAAPAGCGDGVVTAPETCDPPGSCPTSCDDGLGCTIDTLVGSAATCDVACERETITACASGDGCCAVGCTMVDDDDCLPYTLDPFYGADYEVRELGSAAGVPAQYGGLTIHPDRPDVLLIGGTANQAGGALYEIALTRDGLGHITGLSGEATQVALAAYNDGGVVFGPGDVLFLARWPQNELGQMRPGSADTDKIIPLGPLEIVSSPGGLAFVPPGHPGEGSLKLVSWSGGQWYDLTIADDGTGLFDITAAPHITTITGGPEGIAYVPLGSPKFDEPSVLISEYSAGKVATYEVDASGDPILETRRDFLIGLVGAEGAAIDPVSGDFLFSTFGGGDRIVVVRGFTIVVE